MERHSIAVDVSGKSQCMSISSEKDALLASATIGVVTLGTRGAHSLFR